jgi:hypothetical protein
MQQSGEANADVCAYNDLSSHPGALWWTGMRRGCDGASVVLLAAALCAAGPATAGAAALKWKIAGVSGSFIAQATAGYPEGQAPCSGLYNGYVGGISPRKGFQQGGAYKAKVSRARGSLAGATGKGDLSAAAKITYEQAGFVVCSGTVTKQCDETRTATLDMKISIRGRKLYWDPGGDRDELPGLGQVAVVPPFTCKLGGDEARIDWESRGKAKQPCATKAPSLSSLSSKHALTLKLTCQVKGDLISPVGRPSYGFKNSYPFTGRNRNYFRIGDPLLAEHTATVKLVRS